MFGLGEYIVEDISRLTDAELIKKIKDLKEKGKSFFKNPIDDFTDIDDLLRQNLILQRDLIEEQHISNQLLLHILFKEDSDGSIIPYEPKGINTEAILESLGSGDNYQTLNRILSGKDANFSEKGSGFIDTIKFVSPTISVDNKDYSVEIVCDDNILYKDTWDNLEIRTATEKGMVCYEDDIKEQYLLIFYNIFYTESFEMKVFNSKAIFSLVQVKYHRKV